MADGHHVPNAQYSVWCEHPYRWREFETLEAAERSARSLCRLHNRSVEISGCAEGNNGTRIATVRKDALGRVWTDLATAGAVLL